MPRIAPRILELPLPLVLSTLAIAVVAFVTGAEAQASIDRGDSTETLRTSANATKVQESLSRDQPAVLGSTRSDVPAANFQQKFSSGGIYCFQFHASTNAQPNGATPETTSGAAAETLPRMSSHLSRGNGFSTAATNPSTSPNNLVSLVANATSAQAASSGHSFGNSSVGNSSFSNAGGTSSSNFGSPSSTTPNSKNAATSSAFPQAGSDLQAGNYQLESSGATDSGSLTDHLAMAQMADSVDNNQMDGDDLANWSTGYGNTTGDGSTGGDYNDDQRVDGSDFLSWQLQTGSLPPQAVAIDAAAPEPTALCIWAITAAGSIATMSGRRRTA